MLIDHPANGSLWRHDPPKLGPCYVCGERTEWIELDIGYKHEDCDLYPTNGGHVRVVRGVRQANLDWRGQ